jgi:hypothetical protein
MATCLTMLNQAEVRMDGGRQLRGSHFVGGDRRRWVTAYAVATVLLVSGRPRAQEPVIVSPPPSEPKPAERPNVVPLDEHTAHMIGARRFKLGVLAFDYGVTDRISFGTDPPVWAIGAVRSVFVPNLHVKGNFLHTAAVDVSGQVAGFYAGIGNTNASGQLVIVPLTLFVSTRLTPRLWLHLEGAYNWSRAWGAGDIAKTDFYGTVVMRTAQVGAMAELRISRVVALLLRGRYQFYETPIVFQGSGMLDPYTHADASLEATPLKSHPAMGIAGVALTWKHVGVVAGAGYGHYFVPGANLALPYNGIVPEGSLWALF